MLAWPMVGWRGSIPVVIDESGPRAGEREGDCVEDAADTKVSSEDVECCDGGRAVLMAWLTSEPGLGLLAILLWITLSGDMVSPLIMALPAVALDKSGWVSSEGFVIIRFGCGDRTSAPAVRTMRAGGGVVERSYTTGGFCCDGGLARPCVTAALVSASAGPEEGFCFPLPRGATGGPFD